MKEIICINILSIVSNEIHHFITVQLFGMSATVSVKNTLEGY